MYKKSLLRLKCLGNLLKFVEYMKIYFKIKEIVDFNVSQHVETSFRNFIRKIKKAIWLTFIHKYVSSAITEY